MMRGAAQRYREILAELLLQRALGGGTLPDEEEARFAGDLDVCWNEMTDDERRQVEHEIQTISTERATPSAPERLSIQDLDVAKGERRGPRTPVAA